MNSLSQIVEVVIGVDTHVETHTAAVVDARTGAVLDELTVPTTPQGYQDLVDLAEAHSALRVWAIEGTGGHGAGLARHLARGEEVVVELDRPERRRHGAKSDPLDAVRAAREALARPEAGYPPRWWGPSGPVGAAGRAPLGGRRLHRGATAAVLIGHRRP